MKKVFAGLPEFKIAAVVFMDKLHMLGTQYSKELLIINQKHKDVRSFNHQAKLKTFVSYL